MQIASSPGLTHERPSRLEFIAGGLLAATVVLHVVAMFPTYFTSQGSLASQTDQAALYAVLAASWALALAIGASGPDRTKGAAALAVGIAATEFGFRLADVGDAVKYGTQTAGAGLWLMAAAWAVGLLAAGVSVLAVLQRHRPAHSDVAVEPASGQHDPAWDQDDADAVELSDASPEQVLAAQGGLLEAADNPYYDLGAEPAGAVGGSEDSGLTAAPPAGTTAVPAVDAAVEPAVTGENLKAKRRKTLRSQSKESPEEAHERNLWTILVFVLAAITAGAFLPAWDRGTATSSITGQSVVRNLGNAFSGPWQQVVGTVVAAAALLILPVVAVRLRNKGVGAALAAGAVLVLGTQLVAAVVQVNLPVPPADFGLSQAQASQLGLVLSVKLTGWFVVDAIASYLLFAAVIVRATLRDVPQGARSNRASLGQAPWSPDAPAANPWGYTPPPSPWGQH
jgi:hypothetical protein